MSRHRRDESGTALLLFPAGVLVILILSAIAVDLSAVHAARRSLQRAVDAAADDAVAQLDLDRYYRHGEVAVDVDAARRSVLADLVGADVVGGDPPEVVVGPGPRPATIRVEAAATVPRIFAAAVPGVPGRSRVRVAVVAELFGGP